MLFITGERRGPRAAAVEPANPPAAPPVRPLSAPLPPLPSASPVDTARAPQAGAANLRAKRWAVVDDLTHLTRYPPYARPLNRSMTDILEPHGRHESAVPLHALLGVREAPDDERDLFVLLTGPRYDVLPGEPLAATLTVTRGMPGPARPPVALGDVEATVLRFGQPEAIAVGSFPLNDDGAHGDAAAGDGTYSAALPVDTFPALRGFAGMVFLRVRFRVGAAAPVTRTLDFLLAGDPPAHFVGPVDEELREGELVLTPRLRVSAAGHYLVRGLLFDGRDEPVGYATFRGYLPEGEGVTPLRFPGLLFHEAGADGPFRLRGLTGRRLASGSEATDRLVPDAPWEHTTRPYPRRVFASAEWASAARQRVLEEATRLADDNPPLVPHTRPTVADCLPLQREVSPGTTQRTRSRDRATPILSCPRRSKLSWSSEPA